MTHRGPGRYVVVAVCVNPHAAADVPTGRFTGQALVTAGSHETRLRFNISFQAAAEDES